MGNCQGKIPYMPRRVILLDPKTVNQIAAGEVVERPASVIKELIENSLDAQATRIEIQISQSGKKSIVVSDNGVGMCPEDAEQALERHATSKIRSPSDLQRVSTLGFRGEALPSIASVSKMTLSTGEGDGSRFQMVVEYGEKKTSEFISGPRGTEVSIEGLFQNTPARLKFLKSDLAEMQANHEVVTRYMMAHPFVAFRFCADEQVVLQTDGSGGLLNVLIEVLGLELAKTLAEVDTVFSGMRIRGFVSPPYVNRPTRSQQWVFVNGRPVRSKVLYAAIDAAYRSLTPEKRYAVCVLSMDVDPAGIDVNVSPTKSEIKFQNEGVVFDAIRLAIKTGLESHGLMPSAAPIVSVPPFVHATGPQSVGGDNDSLAKNLFATTTYSPEMSQRFPFIELLDDLRVLGQIAATFIVASTRKGLVVIDQHVAHERVLYEVLCGLKGGGAIETQSLVTPESVEFDRSVSLTLSERLEELASVGFRLEPFGKTNFLIRSVPAVVASKDYRRILQEVVEEIASNGHAKVKDARHKIWITSACRMAVKAGELLQLAEMEQLIRDLAETENPYLCPHGRPITLTLTLDELMRRFGRA